MGTQAKCLPDYDVFEKAIASFSANDQIVQREIRAAVDRLTHIDDESTTFAEALAREHANILLVAGEGAIAPGQAIQTMRKYCDSKTAEHDGGGILILNQRQKQVFVGLVG